MDIQRRFGFHKCCHAGKLPNLLHHIRQLRTRYLAQRNAVRVRKCPIALRQFAIVERRIRRRT